jgi:photosynthesis system II assembly factor YCF48-like protein
VALDNAVAAGKPQPPVAVAAPPVLTAGRSVLAPELKPAEPARVAVVPSSRSIEGPIEPVVTLSQPPAQGGAGMTLASTMTRPAEAAVPAASDGLAFADLKAPAAPTLERRGDSSRRFSLTVGSRTESFGNAVSRKTFAGSSFSNHTRWSTTGTGQLQRAGDGTRWQPVTVAEGVIFQSVDQGGSEVWAGGTGGALYHSRDDGTSWSKVTAAADGETLREDITSVNFHQPGSITVRTASGATWVSADGGLHWARHR